MKALVTAASKQGATRETSVTSDRAWACISPASPGRGARHNTATPMAAESIEAMNTATLAAANSAVPGNA